MMNVCVVAWNHVVVLDIVVVESVDDAVSSSDGMVDVETDPDDTMDLTVDGNNDDTLIHC